MTYRSCAALLALTMFACDSNPGEGEETNGDGDGDAWFQMGQGEFDWLPVEDGDTIVMVMGGQGLLMFPMPVHANGFTLPPDPGDWTHPDIPILDIHLDIEGYNIGFGGHFSRIANYPVPFAILADGTYEFIYITMFVPDELADPCEIDGLPGHFEAELETADGDVLTWARDVVISVPDELCATPPP